MLITILGLLGMQSAGFYGHQTPDILPKMSLFAAVILEMKKFGITLHIFFSMVPIYSVSLLVYNVYISVRVILSFSVTNIKKFNIPKYCGPDLVNYHIH